MRWNTSLLCIAVCLSLLSFSLIKCFTYKHSKHWHDNHTQIHEKRHSMKRLCDSSLNFQTEGATTQKCSSGFYREWAGSHKGQCVPCSCNGLSDECDEQTGRCVGCSICSHIAEPDEYCVAVVEFDLTDLQNCRFNTTGDHCEQCKEGYYGNAAIRTCRACPCPSSQHNLALACLEISFGVVECLCKRGYSGARCERCAFGYHGNPMMQGGICKPCNCTDRGLNICDPLTGECIRCDNSSCNGNCQQWDKCAHTLLVDLDKMDDGLTWIEQQFRTGGLVSFSLNHLQANALETKVGRQSSSARHLYLEVEQLWVDVISAKNDLSQLTNETLHTTSNLGEFLQNVNVSAIQVQEHLSEAEGVIKAVQGLEDLIKQQISLKPEDSNSLSEKDKDEMMEEAQKIMQEIREKHWTTERNEAGSTQEGAYELLSVIRNNMSAPAEIFQTVLNQMADSLMASDSYLREVARLLLDAEDAVKRTRNRNRENLTVLQHLQHILSQLESAQRKLHDSTADIFSELEDIQKELAKYAAQMDGAMLELSKKLNITLPSIAKVDTVAMAEEHVEELNAMASELHQVLYNATSSTEQLRILGAGGNDNIIKALETAESTVHQSREAADQALKVMEDEGLIISAEEMRDNSVNLLTEVNNTESHFKKLSRTARFYKDGVKKQKEKGESLREGILKAEDDIKQIETNTTGFQMESVKAASAAANSSVSHMKERLRNIGLNVERITATKVSLNMDDVLTDANRALKSFNSKLPLLNNKLVQIKALSGRTLPSANMTESIMRIKDIINETRSFVNRLSAATTFNGKGHIELHPPKNLEDMKAFTAVDLSLNCHHTNPRKSDHGRKRRQQGRREDNLFVFYLGSRNASGDYIGMAIRNTVLICVYKLGGIIHEVETSEITVTDVNSSNFDRVFFRRVYQDAEVSITQNYTSQKPVSLPPIRHLPDTMTGVLSFDPDGIVFYVGGYPEDFTPPEELRYHKYRGAIKFSYINDSPVCLFNYKRAVNMEAKHPAAKNPQAEVSDYYEGTGYRMALVKDPEKKRRLFKFHTNSPEMNALLFYIGNEESFFSVSVESGVLVLRGQQADQELRVQTPDRVSLSNKQFTIIIAERFVVHYGSKKISTDYIQTSYTRYYIGGLPAQLRQRHNITAAPFRGCMDHLTTDAEIVEFNRTIGVSGGCPVSILGVRAAALFSPLAVESLFVWKEPPMRVSLSFSSKHRHAVLLESSFQDFQLSLADGFLVFKSFNFTLRSDKRYSDGFWHYLSAEWMPTRIELSVDNVNVVLGQSSIIMQQDPKFTVCIANIYARRPDHELTPADLSMLSQTVDIFPGQCRHHTPSQGEFLAESVPKNPQKPKPTPEGSQCRHQQTQQEYLFSEATSWLSYTLTQQDLDYRPHFSLHIKTKTSKGLILHVAGRGVVPLLALYISNGKIKMSLGLNRTIQHKQKSNDGNWHKVELSIEKNTFHLLVDGIRVTDGHLPNDEGSFLDFHNHVYLGGDPERSLTKEHNIPTSSVIGCIRDFKMNNVAFSRPDFTYKTLPCFDGRTEMGTYFSGGHIVLDNFFIVGSHFELSFELRPQHLMGLLFHLQSDKTSLNVYLMENKVGVKINGSNGAVSVSVRPHKNLCDGKFHVVRVSKQHAVIKLVVDSTSEQKEGSSTSDSDSTARHSVYIGGTTNQDVAPVSSPFIGCLRNVKFNRKSVAFEKDSRVVGSVNISECPVQSKYVTHQSSDIKHGLS